MSASPKCLVVIVEVPDITGIADQSVARMQCDVSNMLDEMNHPVTQ
jgi:hypothetical protein